MLKSELMKAKKLEHNIEGLEKIRELYFNEGGVFEENNRTNIIDYFMKTVIDTFKDQSDQITDLRKYIAETLIDYDNIKEVKNLNGR